MAQMPCRVDHLTSFLWHDAIAPHAENIIFFKKTIDIFDKI